MACLQPHRFTLETTCPVPWNASQESPLHKDYPLSVEDENEQAFVIRRYLETLWLPESISPLPHMIHSLQRMQFASTSQVAEVHPLHALLEDLLLPLHHASEKYHTELPQILHDEGGAGEQEESMMWYAWEHERGRPEPGDNAHSEWRRCWLERLEKRETMIQLLLYMLKLSLPGPPPPAQKSRRSKKRKRAPQNDEQSDTTTEILEQYMDKLSMWQLTASLDILRDGTQAGKPQDDRDWTQKYCEEVVEPLFKTALPPQCSLLRSKLFPTSIFSDDDAQESDSGGRSLKASRSRTASRGPSPLPDGEQSGSTHPSQQRDQRSRSLSVSLAEDQDAQKKNLIEPRKNRAMTREISMSRVFKDREKQQKETEKDLGAVRAPPVRTNSTSMGSNITKGRTLVEDTPMKRPAAPSRDFQPTNSRSTLLFQPNSENPQPASVSILVDDTPVKPRNRDAPPHRKLSASVRLRTPPPSSSFGADNEDEDEEDRFNSSFGSPDVLLLGGPFSSPLSSIDGDADELHLETPSKKRVAR
ncbi:hypothetical protein BD410DRAFT_836042 [Rickenella mellea]|uniref:DNA replication regulator Sld3 C-terminal domain-containing protein n=1 Tax=Rickenella mellea TaxID=50990 RepID=A0A4Y7QH17_9AGAM|nr:hypothetical protein BD410DRAFT_836042 [Rickenella mellea]